VRNSEEPKTHRKKKAGWKKVDCGRGEKKKKQEGKDTCKRPQVKKINVERPKSSGHAKLGRGGKPKGENRGGKEGVMSEGKTLRERRSMSRKGKKQVV